MTSAVSGKTNYLVVGSKLEDGREVNTGSKYVKAKSVGTTIFTEDEFEEFLRKKLDNPNFQLENYRDWRNKNPPVSISPAQLSTLPTEISSSMNPTTQGKRDTRMWTDKYNPVTSAQIIGNKSSIDSL